VTIARAEKRRGLGVMLGMESRANPPLKFVRKPPLPMSTGSAPANGTPASFDSNWMKFTSLRREIRSRTV